MVLLRKCSQEGAVADCKLLQSRRRGADGMDLSALTGLVFLKSTVKGWLSGRVFRTWDGFGVCFLWSVRVTWLPGAFPEGPLVAGPGAAPGNYLSASRARGSWQGSWWPPPAVGWTDGRTESDLQARTELGLFSARALSRAGRRSQARPCHSLRRKGPSIVAMGVIYQGFSNIDQKGWKLHYHIDGNYFNDFQVLPLSCPANRIQD